MKIEVPSLLWVRRQRLQPSLAKVLKGNSIQGYGPILAPLVASNGIALQWVM